MGPIWKNCLGIVRNAGHHTDGRSGCGRGRRGTVAACRVPHHAGITVGLCLLGRTRKCVGYHLDCVPRLNDLNSDLLRRCCELQCTKQQEESRRNNTLLHLFRAFPGTQSPPLFPVFYSSAHCDEFVHGGCQMKVPNVCWKIESDGVTIRDTNGKLIAQAADALTAKTIILLPFLLAQFVHTTQQRSAHRKVFQALAKGKLKQQPCGVCGARPTEAHHPDYLKPLEVEWLCGPHHRVAGCPTFRGFRNVGA